VPRKGKADGEGTLTCTRPSPPLVTRSRGLTFWLYTTLWEWLLLAVIHHEAPATNNVVASRNLPKKRNQTGIGIIGFSSRFSAAPEAFERRLAFLKSFCARLNSRSLPESHSKAATGRDSGVNVDSKRRLPRCLDRDPNRVSKAPLSPIPVAVWRLQRAPVRRQ